MTRWVVVALAAAALAVPAGGGSADFPEQPGTHTARGCAAIATNPGAFPVANQHSSPTAQAIVLPLFVDACFG